MRGLIPPVLVLAFATHAVADEFVQISGIFTRSAPNARTPTLVVGDDGVTYRLDDWWRSNDLRRISEVTDSLSELADRPITLVVRIDGREGDVIVARPWKLISPRLSEEPFEAVVGAAGSLRWPGQDDPVEAYGPAAALLDASVVGRKVTIRGVLEYDAAGKVSAAYAHAVRGKTRHPARVYRDDGQAVGWVSGQTWLRGVADDGRVIVPNREWLASDTALFGLGTPRRALYMRRGDRDAFEIGASVETEEADAEPTTGGGFSQVLGGE